MVKQDEAGELLLIYSNNGAKVVDHELYQIVADIIEIDPNVVQVSFDAVDHLCDEHAHISRFPEPSHYWVFISSMYLDTHNVLLPTSFYPEGTWKTTELWQCMVFLYTYQCSYHSGENRYIYAHTVSHY